MNRPLRMTRTEFISAVINQDQWSKTDKKLLKAGLTKAGLIHKDQLRASGDPYLEGHCLPVAYHLYSLGLEASLVAAGLLHDVLEDSQLSLAQLEAEFGTEIAFLVNSVSRLKTVKYQPSQVRIDSLRKFFVALAQDVRVIVLKLCDRLHNLETLEHLSPGKRKRIAQESLLIHGQLAARLNMGELAQQINDAAFVFADPANYQKTVQARQLALADNRKVIEHVYRTSLAGLTKKLNYQPLIDRRLKGYYSLYKKLAGNDWQIKTVNDLVALRIIVKNQDDCYQALSWLHQHYRPVTGRLKDYIGQPKTNGYQSLHTTIFSGHGGVVEFQIKTRAMHHFNEYGPASHFHYKQHQALDRPANPDFDWLRQLNQLEPGQNQSQYLKQLKTDFFADRIFVMTPKGDVIDLPAGASALDFAFAVHSHLGRQAKGARINGSYKAIKSKLATGDIVEIIKSKTSQPSRQWLTWVNTSLAKRQIKNCLKPEPKSPT